MPVGETTTYRVETLYDVTDRASKALQEIGVAAEKAGKSTESLKSVLVGLGAGALISRAFAAGKAALIDFNSGVEKAKISLATVTAMNLSAPFSVARVETDKLYATFQKMAAQSPATTQDFINMANMISGGVMQAGLGLKGLESITKGAITASSALGAPAEMLGLDVTQMLAGTVAIRDRYARQLLAGIGESDYHKFNAYDATKRAKLVQKAFDQPALAQAADAFGESFAGVTSTLKDNLEIGLGKVGLPLFQAITKEVKSWNDWMGANQNKLEAIGQTIGDGLVKGFQMAKTAAQFLVDNAGTLIEIGKVWLLFKIGGGLGGTLGGIGGKIAGVAGGLSGSSKFEDMMGKQAIRWGNGVGLAFGAGAGGMVGGAMTKIGALGGAAGSLGIGEILQTGLIAHELGEYLGVHKAITAVIDPQKVKYEQLTASMKMWDDAIIASKDKLKDANSALGTVGYANAMGAVDVAKTQAEAMKDAIRELGSVKSNEFTGFQPDALLGAQNAARSRLTSGGLTPDEVERFMNSSPAQRSSMYGEMSQRATVVQTRSDLAVAMTEDWVGRAMNMFHDSEKADIDLKEGTARVYDLIQRLLANPETRTAFGKGIGSLDVLEVMAELRGTKSGLGQAKAPVTNIKIDRVEVSAKDPDRWIAELDAKAKRKVTAPTQAKGAVRGPR